MQITGETVFKGQMIVRIGFVVVQMSESVVKITLVTVISYFDDSIFYPKSISVIISGLVMMNFSGPAAEIFPVKHIFPSLGSFFLSMNSKGNKIS
jgi:hypothetical protein